MDTLIKIFLALTLIWIVVGGTLTVGWALCKVIWSGITRTHEHIQNRRQ